MICHLGYSTASRVEGCNFCLLSLYLVIFFPFLFYIFLVPVTDYWSSEVIPGRKGSYLCLSKKMYLQARFFRCIARAKFTMLTPFLFLPLNVIPFQKVGSAWSRKTGKAIDNLIKCGVEKTILIIISCLTGLPRSAKPGLKKKKKCVYVSGWWKWSCQHVLKSKLQTHILESELKYWSFLPGTTSQVPWLLTGRKKSTRTETATTTEQKLRPLLSTVHGNWSSK